MADDNELTLKDPAAAKKKKLIMIVALVVILLGAAAGPVPGSCLPVRTSRRSTRPRPSPKPVRPLALYVGMPRPFVFNVAGGQQDRLWQIKIQLMAGPLTRPLAKQNIPRSKGTLLYSASGFHRRAADDLSRARRSCVRIH